MRASKNPYSIIDDLWYSLREGYSSFDTFSADFIKYLDASVELLKSLPESQRLNHLLPIEHNNNCGRNIAYSLITTISACRDNFIDYPTAGLNNLLVAAVDAFSSPNFSSFWTDLYDAIDRYKSSDLK